MSTINKIRYNNTSSEFDETFNLAVAEGYVYMGVATPSTNPGTPESKVFYIANTEGTYTYFNSSIILMEGELAIIKYNGNNWSKDSKFFERDIEDISARVGFAVKYPKWSDGYINGNNGQVLSSSTVNKKTDPINVNGYDKLIFIGSTFSASTDPGYYFYDSNNTPISGHSFDVNPEQVRGYKVYTVNVPSNAKYFRTSLYNEFLHLFYIHLYKEGTLEQQIIELQKDGGEVFKELDYLYDELIGERRLSPGEWTDGKYLDRVSHNLVNSTVNSVTDYIDIDGFSKIRITLNVSISIANSCLIFYDNNKTFVSVVTYDYNDSINTYREQLLDVPENAKFIRVSFYTENKDKFYCYGVYSTEKKTVLAKEVPLTSPSSSGYWIHYPASPAPSILSSSVSSHFEPIYIGKFTKIRTIINVGTTSASDVGIIFTDINKNLIQYVRPNIGLPEGTTAYCERILPVPERAAYIYASIRTAFLNDWYMYGIVEEGVEEQLNNRITNSFQNDIVVGTPEIYTSEDVVSERTIINSKTTDELYEQYDLIATSHPEYFVKLDDIGSVTRASDSKVFSIRQYKLGYNYRTEIDHEPTSSEIISQNLWNTKRNPRKLLLVSGMHGEEHTPCWGMMLAIKEICESNEQWAVYIRSNFDIYIIPCLNPRGWDICTRGNTDGVDLNRAAAYNAPESTAYMDWINSNKDAFILFDVHGTQGRYMYLPTSLFVPVSDRILKLANKIGAALYNNFKNFYRNISEGFETTYSPFIVAKRDNVSNDVYDVGRYSTRMYQDYGMQEFAIETPDDLLTGSLGNNDLRCCKLTKDMLINALQYVGSMGELPTL